MILDDRIKSQFPGLVITLLSVLIGLDLGDVVQLARERMILWPLDLGTLRTWGQLITMVSCGASVWIVFAHVGISRLRIPSFADSALVFLVPLAILLGNSLVGTQYIWPWFYWASAYLLVGLGAWHWQVRMVADELPAFLRLKRPLGPLAVLYGGVPSYFFIGWADSRGHVGPMAEMLVALVSGPLAIFTVWLFFREWHQAIAQNVGSDAQGRAD